MTVWNGYRVEYYKATVVTGWIEIPEVFSLTCSIGRQQASDQWPVSEGVVRARWRDSFDDSNLQIGSLIRWFAPNRGATKPSWTGVVKNIRFIYDMPYAGGVGNGDVLEIEIEGFLARLGRRNEDLQEDNDSIYENYVSGIWSTTNVPNVAGSLLRLTAGDYNFGTALQRMADTVQGRLCDGVRLPSSDDPTVYLAASTDTPQLTLKFSDTTNDSTNREYFEIQFDGAADDFFTDITVTPELADPQTVQTSIDLRALDVQTWHKFNGSALELARYLSVKFAGSTPTVSRIAARTPGQQTQNLDTLGVTDLEFGYLIKYRVQVVFRGVTYWAQIEGVELVADLDQSTFTYYLSPVDAGYWFTLDSADYGRLDEDRLGYV